MDNDIGNSSKLAVPGRFSLTYLLFIIWLIRDCLQCASLPTPTRSIPHLGTGVGVGGVSHQWIPFIPCFKPRFQSCCAKTYRCIVAKQAIYKKPLRRLILESKRKTTASFPKTGLLPSSSLIKSLMVTLRNSVSSISLLYDLIMFLVNHHQLFLSLSKQL